MIFSEAITTTTRSVVVPKAYDTITRGSPTILTMLQNSKPWKTGIKYEFPIKYQDSSNGGVTGIADKLDTDRQNVRTMLSFEPKMITKPIVLATIELSVNQGEEAIVDLLETEFDSQAQSLSLALSNQLFNGTGAGNSWDSLLNAADDGTNSALYGGKSKTTYPSLKGYYLASAGALTLAKMATAYDAVLTGMDTPTHIVTTKALWSVYESLLNSTVVANYSTNGYPKYNAFGSVSGQQAAFSGGYGFDVLYYRGTPVIRDEQVSAGNMYLINANYFGFKGIKLKDLKQLNFKKSNDGVNKGVLGRVPTTYGFNFRDLMNPVDQLAEVGHLIYAGNFISEITRSQGRMVGLS